MTLEKPFFSIAAFKITFAELATASEAVKSPAHYNSVYLKF